MFSALKELHNVVYQYPGHISTRATFFLHTKYVRAILVNFFKYY